MNNNTKRLYKSDEGKMICGVCQGLSEYFNLDPSIVRIAAVVLTCACGGSGILAYLIAAVILPEKKSLNIDL